MGNLDQILSKQQFAEVPLTETLLNLLLCIFLTSLIGWFYRKYSRSLGGKMHIGTVLPLIGMTVFMVITVVKSSLALSLGLVGALSIVRFRTPIKEPEELGFLFLTIAVGLGLGAGFELVTIIVTIVILSYLRLTASQLRKTTFGEYTLVVSNLTANNEMINMVLSQNIVASKLLRMHQMGNRCTSSYNVSLGEQIDLQDIISQLQNVDDSVDIKLIENGVNW